MGIHSVCVSIFRRHWYYIYIFCWFISIYWSWMFAILICSTNYCVWSPCNLLKCDIASTTSAAPCALHCSGNRVVKRGIISPNHYAHCDNIYNIDNSIWMVIRAVCFLRNHEFAWFSNRHEMLPVGRIATNVCGMWSGTLMSCLCLLLCNYQAFSFGWKRNGNLSWDVVSCL